MSKEEVEKMQRDAESHAEEDKKAKEAIEIKNNADTLAYQCEKQLKDLGDKVPEDKKKQVEDAIEAVREAIKANDTDAMKTDLRRLAEQVPGSQRRTLQAGRRERRVHARCRGRRTSRPPSANRRTKVRARTRAMWSTRNSKSSTKTRSKLLTTTICRQPLVRTRAALR